MNLPLFIRFIMMTLLTALMAIPAHLDGQPRGGSRGGDAGSSAGAGLGADAGSPDRGVDGGLGTPAEGGAELAGSNPNYRLGIRDAIRVSVFNEPDLTVNQRIDARGQIRLHLIGTFEVEGMTVREAEEAIEQAYIDQRYLRDPLVTVAVTNYRPKYALVHGAVGRPGRVTFPMEENAMDLVDVITGAGGFSPIARSDRVTITRPGDTPAEDREFIRNVEAMIEGNRREGERYEQFMVQPGDIIFVDERYF